MLQTLSIRDFIIVDALDLDFSSGFTVLTGETGAGKSILIDALSLALGARGEGGVVRSSREKAEISVSFAISTLQDCQTYLAENELPNDDNSLLLRRVIYADGRSRAFINGASATVSQLKDVGEFLVDIYSQHQHHALLKNSNQRQILDDYAGLTPLSERVASAYKTWHTLHVQRMEAEQNAAAFSEELAIIRDDARELAQLAPDAQEWDALQQEHSRLSHGASLLTGGEACRELLSEGEAAALTQLQLAQQKLQALLPFDASLKEAVEALDSAVIQCEEADRFLNRYIQRAELDPERLNEVEARIQAIHNAARKYRTQPEFLAELLQTKQARMAFLESTASDGALLKNETLALQAYNEVSAQLSAGRKTAAGQLSTKISAEMQRLSLSGGQFAVGLLPQAASASGNESVEFLVAGHAGMEPRPLNKVASGGELSRISLAIRVTTASQSTIPTMIFDEVDVGIGGGVAEVVGALLKQLGGDKNVARQALVITHLPQVAAQGVHHLQVSKTQNNGMTLSHIAPLDYTARVEEIARMLGGVEITETTRSHAREMLINNI